VKPPEQSEPDQTVDDQKQRTMKLKSRGMIRMSTPAIIDMIGEMWATVRVIENPGAMKGERRFGADILQAQVPE
jgi:hypothetical protein